MFKEWQPDSIEFLRIEGIVTRKGSVNVNGLEIILRRIMRSASRGRPALTKARYFEVTTSSRRK